MAKIGRPLKFSSVEELQGLIDKYFDETPMEDWTITNLALALDTNRQGLSEYGRREEFADTIKRAKAKVEGSYELDLKRNGRVGTIFALKNFGWTDKQEVAHKLSNDLLVDDGFDNAISKIADELSDFVDKKSLEEE
jgi:hypothetical protein